MTTPTIRDHCATLAGDVDYLIDCVQDGSSDPATLQECADRAETARAVLAAAPVGDGPSQRIVSVAKAVQECAFAHESGARLIGNVCAEDVADLCAAVLARQGRPAASTITVDDWFTVAMVAQDMQARGLAEQACGQDLLKLANSNRSQSAHPATPPAPDVGEAGEVVEWLRQRCDLMNPKYEGYEIDMLTRACTLLEQLSAPAPVVVAERLPGEGHHG